ncbi:uncharacterized protein BX664DRAFT_380687 [Halteromyces radiatus]|uniref:uncharacterized protein n=1 Tax=Halteromyces radiatus TaxID=101107 RepID=UPI002220990B|nr:uncharacterized protein BX664DRAFT_380687 [Halteromyces radiatus]KAI8081709.1 hypothetical protein BX664DRAFT_380687 [Halteromyces radiatus]
MDFKILSKYDDLLSSILLDDQYLWFDTIKMNQDLVKADISTDIIRQIIYDNVIINSDVVLAAKQLLSLPFFDLYLESKDEKERYEFTAHMKRYLLMYLPNAGFEISDTLRYNGVEACVISTKVWVVGDEIRNCVGMIACLNPEDDAELKKSKRDFSVMYSQRRDSNCLFLGPARFMNHDCGSNCKFINLGPSSITFKVVKNIDVNDELTVFYGAHYFGVNNCECRCLTCERNGQGYFSKLEQENDHVETTQQDHSQRRSGRKKKKTSYEEYIIHQGDRRVKLSTGDDHKVLPKKKKQTNKRLLEHMEERMTLTKPDNNMIFKNGTIAGDSPRTISYSTPATISSSPRSLDDSTTTSQSSIYTDSSLINKNHPREIGEILDYSMMMNETSIGSTMGEFLKNQMVATTDPTETNKNEFLQAINNDDNNKVVHDAKGANYFSAINNNSNNNNNKNNDTRIRNKGILEEYQKRAGIDHLLEAAITIDNNNHIEKTQMTNINIKVEIASPSSTTTNTVMDNKFSNNHHVVNRMNDGTISTSYSHHDEMQQQQQEQQQQRQSQELPDWLQAMDAILDDDCDSDVSSMMTADLQELEDLTTDYCIGCGRTLFPEAEQQYTRTSDLEISHQYQELRRYCYNRCWRCSRHFLIYHLEWPIRRLKKGKKYVPTTCL